MVNSKQAPTHIGKGKKIKPYQLEHLEQEMSDLSGLNEPGMKETVEGLRGNMFLYEPENDGNDTWLERDALLSRIHELEPIADPQQIFQTVLNAEDQLALPRIVDEMSRRADVAFKDEHYDDAGATLALLMSIEVIEDDRVTKLLAGAIEKVQKRLDELSEDAIRAAKDHEFEKVSSWGQGRSVAHSVHLSCVFFLLPSSLLTTTL